MAGQHQRHRLQEVSLGFRPQADHFLRREEDYSAVGHGGRSKQFDDALFESPYRGSWADTFLGTEDGPDIRIDDGTAQATDTVAMSNAR